MQGIIAAGGIGGLLVLAEARIIVRQAAALPAVVSAAAGFLAAAQAVVGKTRTCVYNSNHA